jgi:anti-sigma B factor antagonist
MAVQPITRFEVKESAALGSIHTVALKGQLDAHTAPELERFLEHLIRTEKRTRLVLDFTSLEYISSAGLGVLMGFIEEVREQGGDIKLASVPEKIFHVLDLLGFPVVFRIHPQVAEAVSEFGGSH